MRTINIPLINTLNMAFKTLYYASYRKAQPIAEKIADVRDSNSLEEAVAIIGQSPKMREWIGERVVQNFSASVFSIKNKDWEMTVEVDRNDIEDDRLGIYRPQIADMGKSAAFLWDDLVIDLLLKGHQTICYDGQYFFDTDHPVDMADPNSAIFSNSFTGRPLTAANYAYVRQVMNTWKLGPQGGRSLRTSPNILLVGADNEVNAKEIVYPMTIPDGTGAVKQNQMQGTAQVIVHPDITGGLWFLIDASNTEKPIIVAQRKKPEFVAKTDATDDAVFWRKKFHFGVDARGVAAFGPYFLAARCAP